MVAQNTVRRFGVNQVFQIVEGIWLYQKSLQIRFLKKRPNSIHKCATCSELPSYIITMQNTDFCMLWELFKQKLAFSSLKSGR